MGPVGPVTTRRRNGGWFAPGAEGRPSSFGPKSRTEPLRRASAFPSYDETVTLPPGRYGFPTDCLAVLAPVVLPVYVVVLPSVRTFGRLRTRSLRSQLREDLDPLDRNTGWTRWTGAEGPEAGVTRETDFAQG